MSWGRNDDYLELDWRSESAFESIREVLAEDLTNVSDEHIEAMLIEAGIDPILAENFFKSIGKGLKKVGKAALRIAPKALPIVGGAVGTIFGGPAGTALGSTLGSLAGKAVGAASQPRGRGRQGRRIVRSQIRRLPPMGGVPAASQLVTTLLRPEVLNSLLAMAMGRAGKRNVPVAGQAVPVSAITNLIGLLAREATAEYHQTVGQTDEGIPNYLIDEYGELAVDPTNPEERAARLLTLFAEADAVEVDGNWSPTIESFETEAYEDDPFWELEDDEYLDFFEDEFDELLEEDDFDELFDGALGEDWD